MSSLSGLQQELAEETGRLVRWEAEAKVRARASEGRRQQLEQLAAGQAARLPGLEADRRRLQAELGDAAHGRAELDQRTTHARRELDVLKAEFTAVCTEAEQEVGRGPDGPGGGAEAGVGRLTEEMVALRVTGEEERAGRREERRRGEERAAGEAVSRQRRQQQLGGRIDR
jgi:hypothetical protein